MHANTRCKPEELLGMIASARTGQYLRAAACFHATQTLVVTARRSQEKIMQNEAVDCDRSLLFISTFGALKGKEKRFQISLQIDQTLSLS